MQSGVTGEPIAPVHWCLGQPCSLVIPWVTYMRQLLEPLAGINLQYGF